MDALTRLCVGTLLRRDLRALRPRKEGGIAMANEVMPTIDDNDLKPQEPTELAREKHAFGWASLVRVAARVPVPIRTKQLAGSLAAAALLALGAVLGLVALGQSNSRGTELRRLQQQGGYEQLLLTDATQLKQLLDLRLGRLYPLNDRPLHSDEPDLRHFDPSSYQRGFLSVLDQQIGNEVSRLCLDAGSPDCSANGVPPPRLPLTLGAVAPALLQKLKAVDAAVPGLPLDNLAICNEDHALFFCIAGSSGLPQPPERPLLVRADTWAKSFAAQLALLTRKTRARANALVAADRDSYNQSRVLLIGAGAGSLLLALALGLLLSDTIVVPLRKTQTRLARIAAGDFSGHVDVSNRDEIGALAADVNRMNDELKQSHDTIRAQASELADANQTLEARVADQVEELRRQAAELRASRARVVAAADAERRRIERDLHDGTQQYLAGAVVNLGVARKLVDSNPEKAKEILGELQGSAQDAMEAFRDLAHGIYPPLLQDRGLAEALANAARRAPIPTSVAARGLGRYAPEVEATVYFCSVEALQNAGKHAGEDARARVRVWEEEGRLLFEVADDGSGGVPDGTTGGAGISNMRDRLGAIGGSLSIESSSGRGTRVRGVIPLGL
jgi:signal transduction histidine kinase